MCIDKYGENIQSTPLPGDHWRACHNKILHLLYKLCMWAGLPVEMEVFNLFSGLVRQEAWIRVERARQRQSIVPIGGSQCPIWLKVELRDLFCMN